MPKELRFLSINFPFESPNVARVSTLNTATALFDYDVVILRPHPLLDHERRGMTIRVSPQGFSSASRVMSKTIEDLWQLYEQGGLLVVILDMKEVYIFETETYTLSEQHIITNYHFLGEKFHSCVRNRTGRSFSITDPQEPFSRVLKGSDIEWTAFITGTPPFPLSEANVFAVNGHDSFIGATLRLGSGHIVLLPNFRSIDEGAFFDACAEYRIERQGTPPPAWAASVWLPGESDLSSKISGINAARENLLQSLNVERERHAHLVAYKELLYEKGKTRLEGIVRRALDGLGFGTTPNEVLKNSNFEIDGRTTLGSTRGILEVKGSKNQITLDDFSSFPTKILHDFTETKTESKGIFVGNGLCAEPPSERLGNRVFSPHVLRAASTNSVALVNSVELYWAVCGVLSKEIKETEPIREAILGTSGYVDLEPFCGNSPFGASADLRL